MRNCRSTIRRPTPRARPLSRPRFLVIFDTAAAAVDDSDAKTRKFPQVSLLSARRFLAVTFPPSLRRHPPWKPRAPSCTAFRGTESYEGRRSPVDRAGRVVTSFESSSEVEASRANTPSK